MTPDHPVATTRWRILSIRLWRLTEPLRERVRLMLTAHDDNHLEPKAPHPPVTK